MGKFRITTEVISTSDQFNYNINVQILNKSEKSLYDVTIFEDLLTYTNVYFTTLTVNNIPVDFSRKLLLPELYTLKKLKSNGKITLSYPIKIYSKVDQVNKFVSKIKVQGYLKNCNIKVCEKFKFFITSLPPALTPIPRIAIVGAGLAGLTTAYRLTQAGYSPVIYEGSNRLGGRCYSGYFKDGEVYEHGGELIDTSHADIISLIMELGLTLVNLQAGELPKTQETYQVIDYPECEDDCEKYIKYTFEEASYDFFNRFNPDTGLTIFQQIYNDANNTYPIDDPPSGPATPWPLTYPDPVLAAQLDNLTVDQYINQITAFLRKDKNGAKSKLAQVLKVAYVIEFGTEPAEQSSLNLIYLLGFITLPDNVNPPNIPSKYFYLFGYSDELYHTNGGNSKIVEALLEQLQLSQVSIFMNHRLDQIVHRTDLNGQYKLRFVTKKKKYVTPDTFDYAVSAIPFSTYVYSSIYNDWGIDISQSDFSDLKKYAIYHLGMSRNSKLNVQFKNRFWRKLGSNGSTFATSDPYLTTPAGGDLYLGPQTAMNIPENSVGLEVAPVHCPKRDAIGKFEKKYQNTWEVSRSQPQEKGILVDYTGGRYAKQFRTSDNIKEVGEHNKYLKCQTEKFLKQLNFLLPGSTSKCNFEFEFNRDGYIVNVDSNNWKESPWQRGAYSFWQPGQYIGGQGTIINGEVVPPNSVVPFAGFEGVPEPYDPDQTGNFMFAGEQTAYDNQGYMNGAVESGNRVANALISILSA